MPLRAINFSNPQKFLGVKGAFFKKPPFIDKMKADSNESAFNHNSSFFISEATSFFIFNGVCFQPFYQSDVKHFNTFDALLTVNVDHFTECEEDAVFVIKAYTLVYLGES